MTKRNSGQKEVVTNESRVAIDKIRCM